MLAGGEGVLHEHADGHGAYAAGDGGNEAGLGGYGVEIDIALEAVAGLARGVRNACCAHVDDNSALLDHIGCDEGGMADGGNDDVGLQALLAKGGAATVADGDGGVNAFLHHQL